MSSFFRPLDSLRTILIEEARTVLTESAPLEGKSVLVADGKIQAIAEKSEIRNRHGSWDETLDARECLVMPGFVNNHSHAAMTLFRGMAEDLPLFDWLRNRIWPLEAKLTPSQILVGATVGAVEAALSGTTHVTSNYFYFREGCEADAFYGVGLRGVFSQGFFDWTAENDFKKTEEYVRRWHGKDRGRIRIATSPHSAYSCSPDLLKKIESTRKDLDSKHGKKYPILNTLHVAESKVEAKEIESNYKVKVENGVVSYLESLGVLTKETIAAHCIHLTDGDYLAFQKTMASVASCPISNLKVGMGVADLPRLESEGVTLSLGTDGPASNNTLDMFETTKMASLLQKGLRADTTLLGSKNTFEVATIGGARSLHQESEIGSIAVGKKADIVLLDLSKISAFPFHDAYSHIVYSARSGDVRDVLVDGRIVVKNRSLVSVNMEELRKKMERAEAEILASEVKRPPKIG